MRRKIYIAGPCSGLPGFNYPAFHAKAAELRAAGHHVENPAENPEPACKNWRGYMRLAVAQLATCDAVVLLPGWSKSRGACVEHQLAVGMGLEVLDGMSPSSMRETPPMAPSQGNTLKTPHSIYTLRRLRKRAQEEGEERDVAALDAAISALDEVKTGQRLALTNTRAPLLVKRDKFSPRNGSGVRRAKLPIHE